MWNRQATHRQALGKHKHKSNLISKESKTLKYEVGSTDHYGKWLPTTRVPIVTIVFCGGNWEVKINHRPNINTP